jgi:DNA replication protein DnaC
MHGQPTHSIGRLDSHRSILAIGLAIRACQAGHRVLFATASEWVARLADAHTAGRLQPELVRLGRYPLLVVDEVGYIRLVHYLPGIQGLEP